MATLNVLNSCEIEVQGKLFSGKQGAADDDVDTPFELTLTGVCNDNVGSLATASVRTLWDEDSMQPTDVAYFFIWGDQAYYVQVIGTGTNFIVKKAAKVPFVLSSNLMLAAADTTVITGGAEPSGTAIDSIVIGNYSGNTMNYAFFVGL